MNYNIIAILFIIIVLLTFIYFTYFINKKKVVSDKPKNTFQKIETDINSYNINNKGFVNELIPNKKELESIKKDSNENNMNLTSTSHPMYNYATNCAYNTRNDIIPNHKNDLENVEEIFIKTRCNNKTLSYGKDFYLKEPSTDLPIANMPSNFLLNNSTKLSELD